MNATLSAALDYLGRPRPHCIEIGAKHDARSGWFCTDLNADAGVYALDATKEFPLPDESFDFAYSEHMIEHIPFQAGLHMMREVNRVLRPGGVFRVVTPSIGFILRIMSSDRSVFDQQFMEFSIRNNIADPPACLPALFFNNFVRNWGHQFIYDRDALTFSFERALFRHVTPCEFNRSAHPELADLANTNRLPPGYLELQSMSIEGTK